MLVDVSEETGVQVASPLSDAVHSNTNPRVRSLASLSSVKWDRVSFSIWFHSYSVSAPLPIFPALNASQVHCSVCRFLQSHIGRLDVGSWCQRHAARTNRTAMCSVTKTMMKDMRSYVGTFVIRNYDVIFSTVIGFNLFHNFNLYDVVIKCTYYKYDQEC